MWWFRLGYDYRLQIDYIHWLKIIIQLGIISSAFLRISNVHTSSGFGLCRLHRDSGDSHPEAAGHPHALRHQASTRHHLPGQCGTRGAHLVLKLLTQWPLNLGTLVVVIGWLQWEQSSRKFRETSWASSAWVPLLTFRAIFYFCTPWRGHSGTEVSFSSFCIFPFVV